MLGLARNLPTSPCWRPALRAGVMAAALAVIGTPLAAYADWHHGRDHEWHHGWHHGWHHPEGWGYYAPYSGPVYGYNYYAPGYGYYAPGASLNFTIR
ncbi:MAG TPA: hypothetical protein VMB81_14205 [Candidatus Sulfotelmatobacter sp.]|nr:hypothetical protein [Candidatus Sulfotelmatobacter sp.]